MLARSVPTSCSAPAVLYEICRPEDKPLTLMLPVNTSVQDVISAVVKPGGDHVLVKMNSAGGQGALLARMELALLVERSENASVCFDSSQKELS